MNKKQNAKLAEQIIKASFVHILPCDNIATINFNWGFLTAMCIAAENAGMPLDQIEACKQIGIDRATPSMYFKS